MRFTAKGMGDIKGVRFEDINGDVSTYFLRDSTETH